jgi:uncharacterized membrane protein
MVIKRLLRHLCVTPWHLRRRFPARTLEAVAAVVKEGERNHGGEIRVAIEADLPLRTLLSGQTSRERAIQVFSELRVWDTAARNGVLIYLCLADRVIEIVADRGFDGRVRAEQWLAVCREMEEQLRAARYEAAVTNAVLAVSKLIAPHFAKADRNELPDRPALL